MTNRFRSARCFLVMSVASLAAVLALGCGAVATAAPVWDIEEYDNCTQALDDGLENTINWINTANEYCCKHSGGVWNDDRKECSAPPAEGQGAGPVVPPPLRGDLPTVAVAPPDIGAPPATTPVIAPGVSVQPPMG